MSENPLHTRSRFRSFRDKLQVFFLGLLSGLVLGGGFFVLKLDEYVKQFGKTFTGEKDSTVFSEPIAAVKPEKDPKKTKNYTDAGTRNTGRDSVYAGNNPTDTIVYDSLGGPAADYEPNTSDEIVIRKDELLGQRAAGIVELSKSEADTALQKLSGIREVPVKNLQVEFWRSPLNYRGYKMSKSKLVLFGSEPADDLQLYKLDEVIYMKNRSGVFRLDFTSDFRQPERINDATLLARLNR